MNGSVNVQSFIINLLLIFGNFWLIRLQETFRNCLVQLRYIKVEYFMYFIRRSIKFAMANKTN